MDQSQDGFAPQQLPPLPQPQQQSSQHPERPAGRPNSKSGFSFHSHKSHESSGSASKIDLTETSREKASRRLSTKADPRLAMSEAEPCMSQECENNWSFNIASTNSTVAAIASDHSSSLAPLRAIQHRDINGIPIGSFSHVQYPKSEHYG